MQQIKKQILTMQKHGFTLVEMITAMAVAAVVLGTATVLLVQLFDFQQQNDEYWHQSRTVNRFVVAFRSDIRTFGKPEIPDEGNTLLRWKTVYSAGVEETVEYVVELGPFPEQQSVVRTVQKDGQPHRRETYSIPDRTTLWCLDGKDTDAGLVALSLWTAPPGTDAPKRDELNPFDRTLPKSLEQRIDPKYAGHWRTIIARY